MLSDGIRTFFIILIFIILNVIIITKTGYDTLKNDWINQRCNPLVMPFAGAISPDGTSTSENFSYCIQNTLSSYSSVITQPYEYTQSMNTNAISGLADTATATQQQQQQNTQNTANATTGIYNVFLNVIVLFNVIILKLYDSQGKMTGVVVSIMNILTSISNTAMSIWNGPPGQLMKTLSNIHV
jgi:hypothetical protein